jgi:SSS family solute:Na+ symporter
MAKPTSRNGKPPASLSFELLLSFLNPNLEMHTLDWFMVAAPLILVLIVGIYTQQYARSVADFLSAGRVARRYLLAVSRTEMSSGAVVFVATFEVLAKSGFTLWWWAWLTGPVAVFISIFGFVSYRYRETRAMTLAQFLEIRYSKAFRLFAGILGFLAGILNFGIIPAVGARFMVYILGLPSFLPVLGSALPTFIPLMALFLAVNVFITLTGGLITIMMTNCIEGIVSQIMYLVLIFGLLKMFSWTQIDYSMGHQPPGHSLLNPMDAGGLSDFNIWYVAMNCVVGVYATMAWQNRSAYNSAPLTAHEGRMGGLLGIVRGMGMTAVSTLLAVCAYTFLHHPDFSARAAEVQILIGKIGNGQTQEQMQIPLALTHLLPTGLIGALCAILLLGIFGGDSTHLHSWGSLFVQDVILPYRKRLPTPTEHIFLLRLAMFGVAVFAFLFGVLVPPSDYIQMWFAITQGVFTTGAGAVIIGGLYWKKGTTAGAWAALMVGSILSLAGILARQYYGPSFFLNGLEISFFCSLTSLFLYTVVSLLTCQQNFNMDRMLHRHAYPEVPSPTSSFPNPVPPKPGWGRFIGIDENFTLGDKWIAGGLFGWNMLFFVIALIGTIGYSISPWSLATWSAFWHIVAVVIPVIFAVLIGVWFTWGGIVDSIDLFRRLRAQRIDLLDNGAVVNHQNLDENTQSGGLLVATSEQVESEATPAHQPVRQLPDVSGS